MYQGSNIMKRTYKITKNEEGLWQVYHEYDGVVAFQSGNKAQAEKVRNLLQTKLDCEEKLKDVNEELHSYKTYSLGWTGRW